MFSEPVRKPEGSVDQLGDRGPDMWCAFKIGAQTKETCGLWQRQQQKQCAKTMSRAIIQGQCAEKYEGMELMVPGVYIQ